MVKFFFCVEGSASVRLQHHDQRRAHWALNSSSGPVLFFVVLVMEVVVVKQRETHKGKEKLVSTKNLCMFCITIYIWAWFVWLSLFHYLLLFYLLNSRCNCNIHHAVKSGSKRNEER
jgi:hypothetical protein